MMKWIYEVRDDFSTSIVVIEKDKVILYENGVQEILDVDLSKCFNTLISLYSLKEDWKKTSNLNYIYRISFDKEVYEYDLSDIPENFLMFISYINRLVGESI